MGFDALTAARPHPESASFERRLVAKNLQFSGFALKGIFPTATFADGMKEEAESNSEEVSSDLFAAREARMRIYITSFVFSDPVRRCAAQALHYVEGEFLSRCPLTARRVIEEERSP